MSIHRSVRPAVICAIPLALGWWVYKHLCEDEVYETVAVASSDWAAERQGTMCIVDQRDGYRESKIPVVADGRST